MSLQHKGLRIRHIRVVMLEVKVVMDPLNAVQSMENSDCCIVPTTVGQLDYAVISVELAKLVLADSNILI